MLNYVDEQIENDNKENKSCLNCKNLKCEITPKVFEQEKYCLELNNILYSTRLLTLKTEKIKNFKCGFYKRKAGSKIRPLR